MTLSDRLAALAQRVDPTALARNMMRLSDEDKLVALTWLEQASSAEAGDIDRGLLEGLLDGTFDLLVEAGEVKWRLTDEGRAVADRIVANSPDAQRFLASLRKVTRVDGPDDVQ